MTNHLCKLLRVMWVALALTHAGAGIAATRTGIAALEPAIAAVTALSASQQGTAIAAYVSPEGHWTLVNANGEAFTAANPDELKRGWDILLPGLAAAGGKPEVYLTADTVFEHRERLAELPGEARLWLAGAPALYRLRKTTTAGALLAEVKPSLLAEIGSAEAFREMLMLLARPLDRSNFRVLALEPGGPHTLSARAISDRASGRPAVDVIDPNFLLDALPSLRGQTALIVARLDGDTLAFKPASAPERTLKWSELVDAATAADVNVLVLKSPAGQQPGGRNWLWQTFEVKGLDEALTRAILADAFDALGGGGNPLAIATTLSSPDRTVLDVHPVSGLSTAGWSTIKIGSVLSDAMAGLAGKVTHQGAVAAFRSVGRQTELDRRLVPFVPSWLQWGYGALLLLGLAGWTVATRWWSGIWPAETASDYANTMGFWAARVARALAFAVLFVPAVAVIAAPRTLIGALSRRQGKVNRAD